MWEFGALGLECSHSYEFVCIDFLSSEYDIRMNKFRVEAAEYKFDDVRRVLSTKYDPALLPILHQFGSCCGDARVQCCFLPDKDLPLESNSSSFAHWPRGPMDKASAYGAGDCRFETCRGHFVAI